MHVMRSSAPGHDGRVPYLVWPEDDGGAGSREALLVDWDGIVPDLAEALAREGLAPRWHARTSAQQPSADEEAALAAAYPGLRTAWYAACGTVRVGPLKVDIVWTPVTGAGGLSFVVAERAAFVGLLPAAAAARDERAARSLEVVREFASAAALHPDRP